MSILFFSEGVKKPKLSYRTVSKWIKLVLSNKCYKPGRLTFIFCDDNYLLGINVRFLKHDFYTDIVTFDYCAEKKISGDFFISVERVMENSRFFSVTFEEELLRVIVHGLLHLLGFNDSNQEEKKAIREMEDNCILMFENIENGHFK